LQRSSGEHFEFTPTLTVALAAVDHDKALPLLKAAAWRGHRPAATYLLMEDPDGARQLLARPGADKLVALMLRTEEVKSAPSLYQVAKKNPRLSPELRKAIDQAIAEQASDHAGPDPVAAMAEVDQTLADKDMHPHLGWFEDSLRVVARSGQRSAPLIPRLAALQKIPVVAARATWALGEIPDPAAQSLVLASLNRDDDWRVVLVAANALARRGTSASKAIEPLRRIAKEHWHPVVRAAAGAAVQSILGKAPAPAPIDTVWPRDPVGATRGWGEAAEVLSQGFRCTVPAAWPPALTEPCPVPGEAKQQVDCGGVHKLVSGWLHIDGKYPGDESELSLAFLPIGFKSGNEVTSIGKGFYQGITGSKDRAFAVQTEKSKYTGDEVDGTGRAWIAGFERKNNTWSSLAPVELPSALGGVARLSDGSLRLDFPTHRLVLRLAPDGRITSGDCQPDPFSGDLPMVALTQTLLDDPLFAARLKAAGAEVPLQVSFEFTPPDDAPKLHFAGKPVVIEKDELPIVAGRTLSIAWTSRETKRDERSRWIIQPLDRLHLHFNFRAMQIDDSVVFSEERGTWKIVREDTHDQTQAAPPPAPPPPDVAAPPRDALVAESGLAFKLLKSSPKDAYAQQSPEPDDVVSVEILGWTSDGKPYFPHAGKQPASVRLPLLLTLAGLGEGIRAMKTGELRRLWIPARLADPSAPAETKDLVFDVRLVDIPTQEPRGLMVDDFDDEAPHPPRDWAQPPKTALTTASGLKYRVLRDKKGAAIDGDADERFSVRCQAWNKNGKRFVDAVIEPELGGSPQPGARASGALLIPGLAEAIRLVQPGRQYRFWIPAALAHGESSEIVPGKMMVDLYTVRR
jgi:peptidylprolyl isomerase